MRVIYTTLLVCWALITTTAVAQDPIRELTRVEGDVYRFQNNFHASVVVVTSAGVVVTDPINAKAATWLKAEIGKLTDQPITHLVYSHADLDHACCKLTGTDFTGFDPALDGYHAVFGVDPNGDSIAILSDKFLHEFGVTQRNRAQNRALNTPLECVFEVPGGAQAAAEFDWDFHAIADGPKYREVLRRFAECTIKIDDVQPLRTL